VVGDLFKPKTFAGLFGTAPSVALATLAMAYLKEDSRYVALETQSMVIGAVALFVYSMACVAVTKRRNVAVWLGAMLAWGAWGAVAFGVWAAVRVVGGAA
jgi:hypothetical protein